VFKTLDSANSRPRTSCHRAGQTNSGKKPSPLKDARQHLLHLHHLLLHLSQQHLHLQEPAAAVQLAEVEEVAVPEVQW